MDRVCVAACSIHCQPVTPLVAGEHKAVLHKNITGEVAGTQIAVTQYADARRVDKPMLTVDGRDYTIGEADQLSAIIEEAVIELIRVRTGRTPVLTHLPTNPPTVNIDGVPYTLAALDQLNATVTAARNQLIEAGASA